jgi:hypothetical protein
MELYNRFTTNNFPSSNRDLTIRHGSGSIQFNAAEDVLEELHTHTRRERRTLEEEKKRRRGFGVVNINSSGNFPPSYVYKLHKRFIAK